LAAAGLHPPRHFGFGELLGLHGLFDLPRQHTLDGDGPRFFEAVFLPEKIFQGGADASGVDHG